MPRKPKRKAKNGGSGSIHGSGAHTFDAEYKVGPGRPPREYQFKPGQSGNPKGAKKRKPTVEPELRAALKNALGKRVKLTQGESIKTITMARAGIEQLVAQFARGDRHARRDLMWLAEKLGLDLLTEQKQALGDALAPNYQEILDRYVARQKGVKPSPDRTPVFAPPELSDDDSRD